MPRERRRSAWDHFYIIDKHDDPHPHVQCKYCVKEYKRAVPERMQAHLNKKCSEAPNAAKSHKQHLSERMSVEEINSLVSLLAKALSDRSSAIQILEPIETRLGEVVNFHPKQDFSAFPFVGGPYTLTKPLILRPPFESIISREYVGHETTKQFHSQQVSKEIN
ncbi:hypothetical protein RhiirA5_415215 [Rhizophagus irregularis]|uniref:BED-type domain-containing protein n=1 Tax=Rhizophagus irregularis TaxID=588596 RepID=A0A2N0PSH9_9GLOM|nr:hypothetical protein RhiirA5_415215 [Rhizophagus irregularis]CAB5191703.1 unnamed protein product [Rhizophagus irregularis]